MENSYHILVAGSTGYLGLHIVKQLLKAKTDFKALARNPQALLSIGVSEAKIIKAEVTNPNELRGICDGVNVVMSCLGITKQKDGLSYVDVDFQGNLNLLQEAERAGVRKFIYISAFRAQLYPQVRLLNAKERFASILLKSTSITPCVIRPNGFFIDMEEIYNMAKQGRVFTFGDGSVCLNPINGVDLAEFCLAAIDKTETEMDIGGPDILSVNDITDLAFISQKKSKRVTYIPDSFRSLLLIFVKWLPDRYGGPAEFFLTMLGGDSIAPAYGNYRLESYFNELE